MTATLDRAPTSRLDASSRLRIIVLGYIVRGPLGGLAWHHLQYVLGLAGLGHEVYFVEDSGDDPACYDPRRDITGTDPTYGLEFAARAFEGLGMGRCWAYYDAHRSLWAGPSAGSILGVCGTADLVLNLSGVNPLRPWLLKIPARAFVDTDPAFTQVRHLREPAALELARQHTTFFSFADNIGRACCSVPDDGLPWQPTRQPIVLDAWSVTPGPKQGRFTTVMQWDSYRARDFGGRHYGMKSESFAEYLDLPQAAGRHFELAVGSPTAPRDLLRAKGWFVRDPRGPTRDPWTYQRYIRRSKAELSVAKHGYVVTRCGWFSERSAAYLASGRPVVTQETGFSQWLRPEGGVLAFDTLAQALAGIDEVNHRYEQHCRAAREVAEEYFDARGILSRLIDNALNTPRGSRKQGR